jgi:hypothetical protein
MKISIILAIALNVLLITHASKEDIGKIVFEGDNTYVADSEDIAVQFNQDPIGQMKIEEFVKEQGSDKRYEVKDGEARIVPLFATFNYQEPEWQKENILIELSEEEAINLYLFSNFYKNAVDMSPGQDDNGYCEKYEINPVVEHKKTKAKKNSIDENMHLNLTLRADACKAIRSVDFTRNALVFTQVHATHMKMIMEFVNKKHGVSPPEEGYVKGLRSLYYLEEQEGVCEVQITDKNECAEAVEITNAQQGNRARRKLQAGNWDWVPPSCSVQTGGDWAIHFNSRKNPLSEFHNQSYQPYMYTQVCKYKNTQGGTIVLGSNMSSPGDYDINFVNKIWDQNMRDVNYVLFAANYLEINSLAQLMGARIGQEIMSCSLEDLSLLADMNLKNEFLHY